MSGHEDPQEWQDSQGHQGNLVRSSLAKKETEVHQAHEETQVESTLKKDKRTKIMFRISSSPPPSRVTLCSFLPAVFSTFPRPPVLTQSALKLLAWPRQAGLFGKLVNTKLTSLKDSDASVQQ